MPMIDIYSRGGLFADPSKLVADATRLIMQIEQVPDIPMFRKNTAAFIHEIPASSFANVEGDADNIRVQVLTNAGALDRDKQRLLVRQLTDLIAAAGNDPKLADRTWVLLSEAAPGGWGYWGHAYTNEELAHAAKTELARLSE